MRFRTVSAALAVLACGGDGLTLPNEGRPAEITPLRGEDQTGTVGEPLADSLVVVLRDGFGEPVPNIEVTWTAEGGGSVAPATSVTDAQGRAGAQRTLGPQPATYTTIATVAELPNSQAEFLSTAVAARLSLVTQPSPSAASGVTLERQPVIQLLDADGEPAARAGVVVTVQILSGGGSLGGTPSGASDAAGVVTFTDLSIRGEPGIRTLLFAADAFASVTSAPIALGVGAPASIAAVEGNEQSAPVNTAVPSPPGAAVRDGEGNPVPGIPVTFTVASGGGSVTGGTATTGADGVARVGSWVLGTAAGANVLHAAVVGLELQGSPAGFTATGVAGPLSAGSSTVGASPASITASTGDATSSIRVTARDEFGNPIQGLAVGLSADGAGNVIVQPAQPTNASGVATGSFASTSAGPHVISATVAGQALGATATVTVTAAAPAPGNSSASVGSGTAGTRTPVSIQLRDGFNNPVTGAAGRISVEVTGANPATGDPASDLGGGQYQSGYVPHLVGADQIVVRVDGTPVAGMPLVSLVAPGPASPATTTAVVPASASIFSQVPVTVTVRDADGNVRTGGGDEVRVRVGTAVDVVAQHNGDGTYSASFAPPALGNIQVEVLVNGAAIVGSPFSVFITFF